MQHIREKTKEKQCIAWDGKGRVRREESLLQTVMYRFGWEYKYGSKWISGATINQSINEGRSS